MLFTLPTWFAERTESFPEGSQFPYKLNRIGFNSHKTQRLDLHKKLGTNNTQIIHGNGLGKGSY